MSATIVRDATTHSSSDSTRRHRDERGRREVVREPDQCTAERDQRRERRHAHQRRGEHAGHELATGQRQRREALRVEGLVGAEAEHREDRPAERREAEHDDGEVGRVGVAARARPGS